jgi:hypothetical protein
MMRHFRFVLVLLLAWQCTLSGAVIVGTVEGDSIVPSGKHLVPVGGARVVLDGMLLSAESNAQGNYAIVDVPPGTYDIRVLHPDWQEEGAAILTYADTVRRDWTLIPPLHQGDCPEGIVKYAGQITDSSGAPIAHALLTAWHSSFGCGSFDTWTDSSGHYAWKLGYEPDSVIIFAQNREPLQTIIAACPPDPGVFIHKRNYVMMPAPPVIARPDTTHSKDTHQLPSSPILYTYAFHRRGHDDDVAARLKLPPDLPASWGVLRISVRDSSAHSPLPFAYVWIFELNMGARMDRIGMFNAVPIPPGTYTLVAMKNDYFDMNYRHTRTMVTVAPPDSDGRPSMASTTLYMSRY